MMGGPTMSAGALVGQAAEALVHANAVRTANAVADQARQYAFVTAMQRAGLSG